MQKINHPQVREPREQEEQECSLTDYNVTFSTEILENSPASGLCPRPHCTSYVLFSEKVIF